jgi:hypothetical protein
VAWLAPFVLASELFGVKKGRDILSLPYINNVKTMGGIRQLKDTMILFSLTW